MTFVGDEGWMVDASTGRMVVILGKSGVQATNHRIYSRDFVGVYAPCASVGVPFFIFISPRSASRFIYFIRLGAPVRWGLLFFLLPLTVAYAPVPPCVGFADWASAAWAYMLCSAHFYIFYWSSRFYTEGTSFKILALHLQRF